MMILLIRCSRLIATRYPFLPRIQPTRPHPHLLYVVVCYSEFFFIMHGMVVNLQYFHNSRKEGRREGGSVRSGHGIRFCREWHRRCIFNSTTDLFSKATRPPIRHHWNSLSPGEWIEIALFTQEIIKLGRKEGRWKCTKRPWNETLSRMTPL